LVLRSAYCFFDLFDDFFSGSLEAKVRLFLSF
jgi:hypothetical protein